MVGNPICLQIPWKEDDTQFEKWKNGQTGYPFIDAGMRQLLQEGWTHHTVRNVTAVFLTRGDLWLNWEKGCQHFYDNLVDGDWAVNAGNWMWLSSSAFDRLLDCSLCIHPVDFGRRLEPSGDYIRRYVPELANFEFEYIHEPWKAPLQVQRAANCIIGRHINFHLELILQCSRFIIITFPGKDYPERMVIHEEVSPRNRQWMEDYRKELIEKMKSAPAHCHPSSDTEVFKFFFLNEEIANIK